MRNEEFQSSRLETKVFRISLYRRLKSLQKLTKVNRGITELLFIKEFETELEQRRWQFDQIVEINEPIEVRIFCGITGSIELFRETCPISFIDSHRE